MMRDLLKYGSRSLPNNVVWAVILAVSGGIPALAEQALQRATFRDCPVEEHCPEMVAVPAAPDGVILGSPEGETGRVGNEAQHRVRLRGFSIAMTEATVAEYLACVTAKACRPPEWLDPSSPHHITQGTGFYYRNLGTAVTDPGQPVVGVSHADAAAYVQWLANKTGKPYRLPSEREWEYAARAGSQALYWWGDDVMSADGSAHAHCRGCGSAADGKAAAPAKSLTPNPWGLYNMNGNVWEWTADYYCDDYALGPADGSARAQDDCPQKDANDLRTFRGGSSFYGPDKMRAASRLRQYSDFRNFSVGFRVVRADH